jgi:hypothetical protein
MERVARSGDLTALVSSQLMGALNLERLRMLAQHSGLQSSAGDRGTRRSDDLVCSRSCPRCTGFGAERMTGREP